ncbi:MAG: hypothetical protein GDA36_13140 [Rhodobacteraceae bacterium]|nr:hypothetical protein [Paracoccaceae bacterium]
MVLGTCFCAVSNAVRIGADDGLTRIDAPMDWAVVFADTQACVWVLRDLASGS